MKAFVVLAVLSGLSFSLVGICAKLASRKSLPPQNLPLFIALVGVVVFAVFACRQSSLGTPLVVVLGLVAGGSQYLYLRLLESATRQGPLSGAWCAASLAFIPVLLYGWFVERHPARLPHVISMVLAVGCVVAGSRANADTDSGRAPAVKKSALGYLGLLLAVLFSNSVALIITNDLSQRVASTGRPLLLEFQSGFYLMLYAGILTGIGLDLARQRRGPLRPSGFEIANGTVAAAGSIAGLCLVAQACATGGPVTFVITGVAGIIASAIAGVLVFRERLTPLLFLVVLLGVLAVCFGN